MTSPPLWLYIKTAQAAIWLWVMEGGLNFPFEILEPVGKPQLFKCRKSWFYKMLIWSALGTSEQQGSEWAPSPFSLNPAHLLYEAEREEVESDNRVKKYTSALFTCTGSLSTWSCTGEHLSLTDAQEWSDSLMLTITLSLLPTPFLSPSFSPFISQHLSASISTWPHGNFRGLRNYDCLPSLLSFLSLWTALM